MNHLSVEEIAERRAELRKMRELMLRAELKAQRISKIKSKTYRRLKRRGKEKLESQKGGEEGEEEEEEEEEEEDEEARMRREVERAKERATLRHKNTGKWARAMKAKNELSLDERRDIEEMLDREVELRKIQDLKGSDDEGDDEDDDMEGDEADRIAKIKADAFEELRRLAKEGDEPVSAQSGRAVFGMKFMQEALARDKQKTERVIDDFVKEFGEMESEGGDQEVGEQGGKDSRVAVQRIGGRVSFHPDNRAYCGPDSVWKWLTCLHSPRRTSLKLQPKLQPRSERTLTQRETRFHCRIHCHHQPLV